jgi:type I restriction-modification system DNA methylase subunit
VSKDSQLTIDTEPRYSVESISNRVNSSDVNNEKLDQVDPHSTDSEYLKLIPEEKQNELGIYYTPPKVADLLARLTIQDGSNRVLDPACGSGRLLISAYERLRCLLQRKEATHGRLLSQLSGIEIHESSRDLSTAKLARLGEKSAADQVDIAYSDFFKVVSEPRLQERMNDELDIVESQNVTVKSEKFDAILANPPYIQQEQIKNKELCRWHLDHVDADLDAKSDIYSYFFTHSSQFLSESGRIGMVTPEKWLTADYGEDLQQFFLDNFRIEAVISFSQDLFDQANVATCITILESEDAASKRENNIVPFVKIKDSLKIDEISGLVDQSETILVDDGEEYRIKALQQSDLRDTEEWDRFLYAPKIYWQLLNNEKISRLGDVADIRGGLTSGANAFFYLNESEVNTWEIDDQFLTPIAKSSKQVDELTFSEEDTNKVVLDVDDYVRGAVDRYESEGEANAHEIPEDSLPAEAEKSELSQYEEVVLATLLEDGYDGLFDYVTHSMWVRNDWTGNQPHKRGGCKRYRRSNYCWFNLGKLRQPPLIFVRGCWERVFTPVNVDRIVVDNRLHEVYLDNTEVMKGILNSSLYRFFREFHSRTTGGGLSECLVGDAEELPVLDPRTLEPDEKERIKRSADALEETNQIKNKELDRAVLAPLSLECRAEKIEELADSIARNRRGE